MITLRIDIEHCELILMAINSAITALKSFSPTHSYVACIARELEKVATQIDDEINSYYSSIDSVA